MGESLLPALPMIARNHVVIIGAVRDPDVARWAAEDVDDAASAYRKASATAALAERARAAARLRGPGRHRPRRRTRQARPRLGRRLPEGKSHRPPLRKPRAFVGASGTMSHSISGTRCAPRKYLTTREPEEIPHAGVSYFLGLRNRQALPRVQICRSVSRGRTPGSNRSPNRATCSTDTLPMCAPTNRFVAGAAGSW